MDWELTPPAVQDYIESLRQQIKQLEKQVETLQGRVEKTSQTSSKPPSSDSPFNKPKRQRRPASGKRGGQKGHQGQGPKLLTPTEVHLIEPGPYACGHGKLVSLEPYYTHQAIELPPTEMDSNTSSCTRARAAAVDGHSKPRYRVHIKPVMGRP
jgi:transposase